MPIVAQSSIKLKTAIPGPRSQALLARRAESVPRALSIVLPVFVEKTEGAIIEDVDGNRLLDFAGGIGCLNSGHRPPEVLKKIQDQTEKYLHTCFMVTPYEGYLEVAEWLNAHAPGNFLKKTLLVNSGAEAVENAIKVARSYTGRPAIISFEDAFHGRTQLAMSLTSKIHPYKDGFGPFSPEIHRMPYAYCYRCAYNLTYPTCGIECAKKLESLFLRYVDDKSVAAVIFEPILGEGGFVDPPPEWFPTIVDICRKRGILIIADEVQTGFCRTGPVFASSKFQFEPDILVTAKSLSGGLPLGAITGRAEIMDAPGPGCLGGTFGGNPLACASAIGVMQMVDEQHLTDRAEQQGRAFERITRNWKDRFPLIGDLRGVGAMRAIELVKDRKT